MERDAPVLVRVRRLDSIPLKADDQTYFTKEGYLVDHPILTSTGIFEYANPDGSVRRELRLPEEVFKKESLQSYRGKPIIITHDAGVVDKDNVNAEGIGTILSDGYKDGEDVRAEIIVHDTDKMEQRGLKELSLGYSLDLDETPGDWNGEHYDAIQRNIRINHLALVSKARAGDKARLNIDGADDTGTELKGGKVMLDNFATDGDELTPEELKQAIEDFKAKKAAEQSATEPEEPETEPTAPEANDAEGEPTQPAQPTDPAAVPSEGTEAAPTTNDAEGEPQPLEPETEPAAEPAPEEGTEGLTPEELVARVKGHRDTATSDTATLLFDIDCLLAVCDSLLGKTAMDSAEANADGNDKGETMNKDSADELLRQRLKLCRIGDKLNMDGLEDMSILDGKKAIVEKVMPTMRLDGKSEAYVDVAFDLAVGEINKPKDVDYQRAQMNKNGADAMHVDNADNVPAAVKARQNMIAREGGNE